MNERTPYRLVRVADGLLKNYSTNLESRTKTSALDKLAKEVHNGIRCLTDMESYLLMDYINAKIPISGDLDYLSRQIIKLGSSDPAPQCLEER